MAAESVTEHVTRYKAAQVSKYALDTRSLSLVVNSIVPLF